MGRPVVHWELWSEDPEKVSDFYAKVFDWNIRHLPDLNYRLVETGGGPGINGGIIKPQQGPWPGVMTFYIDVEDLDEYRAKIEAAGGKIVVHKMEVPGVGSLSLFEDPERRVIGLWQKNKEPAGPGKD